MHSEIKACRICGNANLVPILDLGEQALTGVFPRSAGDVVTTGPLQLVLCSGPERCGLVQLRHNCDMQEMYGQNYGYRSSLNRAMSAHLNDIVTSLRDRVKLNPEDVVLDIGSNDGTLLGSYPRGSCTLIGIDPTAAKFRSGYRDDIEVVTEFFSAAAFRSRMGPKKAKLITSIAMFYDLPRPMDFVQDVHDSLHADGLWHFEQSYLPLMLRANAYDTVCHEHLEYYALRQVQWMLERTGMRVIDVALNDVNGGSFAVTACRAESSHQPNAAAIAALAHEEASLRLQSVEPYRDFEQRVHLHREQLPSLLRRLKAEGVRVLGYGASTKGNVVLQYCGITPDLLPGIIEVNPDKYGCVTPGTKIPIISEQEARSQRVGCMMVLPWHFRRGILEREREYLRQGGRLLFPLPQIEIVG